MRLFGLTISLLLPLVHQPIFPEGSNILALSGKIHIISVFRGYVSSPTRQWILLSWKNGKLIQIDDLIFFLQGAVEKQTIPSPLFMRYTYIDPGLTISLLLTLVYQQIFQKNQLNWRTRISLLFCLTEEIPHPQRARRFYFSGKIGS